MTGEQCIGVLCIGVAIAIAVWAWPDARPRREPIMHDHIERLDRQDVHVAALLRGKERYVFFWIDSERGAMTRTLARFASDPELSFTWYDAAKIAAKMRQEKSQ
jgi:uncharacterized membrane protein YccC